MEAHLTIYTLLLVVISVNYGFDVSPCPKLFTYESIQTNQWYGVVTLISQRDLSGVWLHLTFDKAVLQLRNWFGEVSTSDNKEYLIENKDFILKAHSPIPVHFYIMYDSNGPVPKLVSFSLNTEVMCSHAKLPSIDSSKPFNLDHPEVSTEEDDYYPGDFAFVNRSLHSNSNDPECGTVIIRERSKRQQTYYPYQYSYFHSYPTYYANTEMISPVLRNIITQFLNTHNNRDAIELLQPQPKPLIAHGEATSEGEFPWHAAIYRAKDFDLVYICGSSLISRFHLLTVAHCVTEKKSSVALNPHNLRIYLGKYYLREFSSPGIQDCGVAEIITHALYNPYTYMNDIAVIKLSNAVQITDFVRPICLWPEENDLSSVLNRRGKVIGWGYDEFGKITNELMELTMPVVSQETCIDSYPQFYSKFTSSRTYCAGYRNGSSVCNGDSGGGMVFLMEDSNRWHLRGLVSISITLRTQFCDHSNYVVFTDSAKYFDWIKKIIKA